MKSDSHKSHSTGSSPGNEPVFVIIGKIRRPHGIRGEVRVTVLTDFPELISQRKVVYVGESHSPYTIKSTRWHGGDLLISFEELPDRTAVEIFRNVMVYMKSEDMPELPKGEFYTHQLVGLEVITDEDEHLGVLKEVLITGANDVYLVEAPDRKDILLPAIDDVILEIDHDNGLMRVHILPGLLD